MRQLRGIPAESLFRRLTPYTLMLWIVGYAWFLLVLATGGRFQRLVAVLTVVPTICATIGLALLLQWAFIATRRLDRVAGATFVTTLALASALFISWLDLAVDHAMALLFFPENRGWATVDLASWVRGTFLYGWVFGFNVALFALRLAVEEARFQAHQLGVALEEAQAAKLAMLRYQLNPHFLFNSLNALSSLILTRQPERAERMIERLSAFLRSTAASNPASLVPLHEELATIEEYLEVEAVRFEDRMTIEYRIDADAGDVLVPSFLLQPIVENAIKYGVAPAVARVTILLAARTEPERLILEVSDSGSGLAPVNSGAGIGLANVRDRLATVFGAAASLDARQTSYGYLVRICLPRQSDHPER